MKEAPPGKTWEAIRVEERRKGALLEAMKLSIFSNCVLQGAKYPDLDWNDRMENIAKGDD